MSTRRVRANRRNAGKSTGPRTSRGKARACRNALRHGFNIVALANPAVEEKVNRLVRMICQGQSDAFIREQALIIAEAEILLMRIRAARVALIDCPKKSVPQQHLDQKGRDESVSSDPLEGWRAALPTLLGFERYERRAISRLRKAMRTLDALQLFRGAAASLTSRAHS